MLFKIFSCQPWVLSAVTITHQHYDQLLWLKIRNSRQNHIAATRLSDSHRILGISGEPKLNCIHFPFLPLPTFTIKKCSILISYY